MASQEADMELDDQDREVLAVLAEGRSNPYHIRQRVGVDKGDCNTILVRLGRYGYVEQVDRGLYRITDKGRRGVDAETDRTAVDVAQLRTALDDAEAAAERGDGAALQDALRRAREAIDDA